MRVRRCAVLFAELDQEPRFDLDNLLRGGDGLERSARWLAIAPHLDGPTPVTLAQLSVLEHLPRDADVELEVLLREHDEADVRRLLDAALILSIDEISCGLARDAAAREVPWWPLALLAQSHGSWTEVDAQARNEAGVSVSNELLAQNFGPPLPHEHLRRPGQPACDLQPPKASQLDELLEQRKTCRNFDSHAELAANDLATMLHRVWGARGCAEIASGITVLKKSSPAGGGLHGTEAYLLAQRVQGLAPGIYHYLPMRHALEPLRTLEAVDLARLAHRFVGGQDWFANAPAMVIMTCRFDRLFWKYRRHSKAWRVAHLDVGHLSQTMYLSAADLGLGAFVTAAINDRDIDAELELPPLREASIAIVGFGPRAAEKVNIELDDLVPTPASQR